jgi:hypothetical protein
VGETLLDRRRKQKKTSRVADDLIEAGTFPNTTSSGCTGQVISHSFIDN